MIVALPRKRSDGPKATKNGDLDHSGSPTVRSASAIEAASAGAQLTPANCWLNRKVGCNSSTFAAAALASSNRPSLASAAASCTYVMLWARIGVNGLVSGVGSVVVATETEMTHRLRVVSGELPGIERAETVTAFAPLDRAFCFTGPRKHDTAKNVSQCR